MAEYLVLCFSSPITVVGAEYAAFSEFPGQRNPIWPTFLYLLLNRGQWSQLSRWHIYIHLTNGTKFPRLESDIESSNWFANDCTRNSGKLQSWQWLGAMNPSIAPCLSLFFFSPIFLLKWWNSSHVPPCDPEQVKGLIALASRPIPLLP